MDEAFIALLEKKDFDYITVKEICESAGVNRSTFYLHYETLGELLQESIEYINRKCFGSFRGKNAESVLNSASVGELILVREEYPAPYLTFIRDNKCLFRTAVIKTSLLNGADTYEHIRKNVITPILTRFNYPPDEIEYVTSFYVNGLIAIVMEWVKNDCREDIPKIIGIIHRVVLPDGNGVFALDRARTAAGSNISPLHHPEGALE